MTKFLKLVPIFLLVMDIIIIVGGKKHNLKII